MKSPYTGGKATLVFEEQEFVYRKETFRYINVSYKCEDTGELFAPAALEDLNLERVYNLYRAKHNIPFPDEIAKIREVYGVSRPQMSKILGFGEHQLSRYENDGEVPSESNGKILAAIKNPNVFAVYLKNAENQLSKKEFDKIVDRIKMVTLTDSNVYENVERGSFNGLGELNLCKATQAAAYLISKTDSLSAAKINAMLLYADLLAYAKSAKSITGLSYILNQQQNIEPMNFLRFYKEISNVESFCDKNGVVYFAGKNKQDLLNELSKKETEILDSAFDIFNEMTEKQIESKLKKDLLSNQNLADCKKINFDCAFNLEETKKLF